MEVTLKNSSEEIKLLIEAKIGSKQGYGQLEKYLRLARYLSSKDGQKAFVVYLTLPGEEVDKNILKNKYFKGHFFWEDVYKRIKDSNRYLTKQFVRFMEEKKMSSMENITKNEADSVTKHRNFIGKIKYCLTRLKPRFDYLGVYKKPKEISIWSNQADVFLRYHIKKEVQIFIGIFLKQENYCYCWLSIEKSIAERKKVDFDKYPRFDESAFGKLCNEGECNLGFPEKLDEVIDYSSSLEGQIKDLEKFFEKGIKNIERTPEYKKIMRN